MFQTEVVKKIKTHILYPVTSFSGVEKYCRAGQATDDNMAHAHCMLEK